MYLITKLNISRLGTKHYMHFVNIHFGQIYCLQVICIFKRYFYGINLSCIFGCISDKPSLKTVNKQTNKQTNSSCSCSRKTSKQNARLHCKNSLWFCLKFSCQNLSPLKSFLSNPTASCKKLFSHWVVTSYHWFTFGWITSYPRILWLITFANLQGSVWCPPLHVVVLCQTSSCAF